MEASVQAAQHRVSDANEAAFAIDDLVGTLLRSTSVPALAEGAAGAVYDFDLTQDYVREYAWFIGQVNLGRRSASVSGLAYVQLPCDAGP